MREFTFFMVVILTFLVYGLHGPEIRGIFAWWGH